MHIYTYNYVLYVYIYIYIYICIPGGATSRGLTKAIPAPIEVALPMPLPSGESCMADNTWRATFMIHEGDQGELATCRSRHALADALSRCLFCFCSRTTGQRHAFSPPGSTASSRSSIRKMGSAPNRFK